MAKWLAFPYDASDYTYSGATLRAMWARLHTGDAEPLPADAGVLAAWALFHAGAFQEATAAGLKAGGGGITVANKAQAVYAHYLEVNQQVKLGMFTEVVRRAGAQVLKEPTNANAHYWLAYGLGRSSQGVSVVEALSQGQSAKVKASLEAAIALSPRHADAHVALGAFHAEVIDKVGSLIGRTQGASKDAGMKLFQQARLLDPGSAIGLVEYANGMVMLEGDKMIKIAEALYAEAAACKPADALERLGVEMAKAELED